jgi:hypothetical protein
VLGGGLFLAAGQVVGERCRAGGESARPEGLARKYRG